MNRAAFLFAIIAGFASLVSLNVPSRSHAQGTDPADLEFQKRVSQLINDGKTDDALRLLNERADAHPGSASVARTLFAISRLLFSREKYDASLSLLQIVSDKFSDAPVASLAWCGMGQIYEKKGDETKMIAALERGVAAPRAWTELNIMDASDTHSYACERLGEHYIKTSQWDKALAVYTDWKPQSWCGTCQEGMACSKIDRLLLCLIQLGRLQEATELAWRSVAQGPTMQRIPEFVLLRLYEESGQRRDFLMLLSELRVKAISTAADGSKLTPAAAKRLDLTARRVPEAVKLLDSSNWDVVLDEFLRHHDEDGYSPSVESHAISWRIVRKPVETVPIVVRAGLADEKKVVPLGSVLTAIDAPVARNGLVRLALAGEGIGHQQEICGLILARVSNPDALIEEVRSRTSEARKRRLYWGVSPAPFSDRFYQKWPATAKNSLPRSLPVDLWK